MKQKKRPHHKSILVVGMGRFGSHLAMKLQELGNTVLAVDKDESIIEDLASHLENTMIADCSKEDFIQTLGISNFDICYVATGETFESTILITSYLKRYGAKYVVTKVSEDIHIDILKTLGADEIVYPERELAEKTAVRHSALGIIDYLPISDEYSIYEIEVPESWIDKSIADLHIRQKYHVNILTVKGETIKHAPNDDYTFAPGDIIALLGTEKNVMKICQI